MPFYLVTEGLYAVLSPSSPLQFGEISKFHHFTTFLFLNDVNNAGFNNCLHKTINSLPLYIKINQSHILTSNFPFSFWIFFNFNFHYKLDFLAN